MKSILFIALCIHASVHSASAATIAFSTPQNIAGDMDVSTTGTLLYAYHFTQAVTVNGVSFSAFPITNFTSLATVGSQTITSADGNLFSANWFGSNSAPFSNLSPEYKSLLQSQVTNAFAMPITLTLGGLTPGQNYQIQIWLNASLNGTGGNVSYHAGNSVTLNQNPSGVDGGLGQHVTGIFTADSASQVLSIQSAGGAPALNAYQIRAIPEPTTTVITLLSATVLLRRKRSVHQSTHAPYRIKQPPPFLKTEHLQLPPLFQ